MGVSHFLWKNSTQAYTTHIDRKLIIQEDTFLWLSCRTQLHCFLCIFQGTEVSCHTSYVVLLCEDQLVVCHLLRLKSKFLRCLPQATYIAFKLVIVSEFRERILYSWRRSLLHIKAWILRRMTLFAMSCVCHTFRHSACPAVCNGFCHLRFMTFLLAQNSSNCLSESSFAFSTPFALLTAFVCNVRALVLSPPASFFCIKLDILQNNFPYSPCLSKNVIWNVDVANLYGSHPVVFITK